MLINLYHDENNNNQIDSGELVGSTTTMDDTGGAPGFYQFPPSWAINSTLWKLPPATSAPVAPWRTIFLNDKTTPPITSGERTQILLLSSPKIGQILTLHSTVHFDLALVKTLGAGQAAGIAAGADVTLRWPLSAGRSHRGQCDAG
ncbi:MAG: hypothetical protein H6645_07265 [Caldilineaceae bacterium]|nr:hypothetical protein [Caldilineaceae bacterium]